MKFIMILTTYIYLTYDYTNDFVKGAFMSVVKIGAMSTVRHQSDETNDRDKVQVVIITYDNA